MSPRVSRQREISGKWAAYVLGVEASERRPTRVLAAQSRSWALTCQRGPFTPLHPSTRLIIPW